MAISGIQVINIGLPNESINSDSLYTAFNKTKDNFTTLFANASPFVNFTGNTGIGVNANSTSGTVDIHNTGVTSIVAGTGISINQSNGAVTITNTGGAGGAGVTSVGVITSTLSVTNSPIVSSGNIVLNLATISPTLAGTYTYPTVTVDNYGRVTSIANATSVGTVTSVGITPGAGIGVTNSPITTSGSFTVTNTGVTRINAGAGISVSGPNGNVTISTTPVAAVTGVAVSSSTLTVTGSPITSSGTITINLPTNLTITGNVIAGNLSTTGNISANNILLPEGSYVGNGAEILTPNGHSTMYSYGSGSHGGPELDWSNTDSLSSFFDPTVYRNTLYLNDTGLYVGLNENGVIGSPQGYLTFDNYGNLNTDGNINSQGSLTTNNITFPEGSYVGNDGEILTANGHATIHSYGSAGHGGPELDWSNTDDLANFYDSSVFRNTLYINSTGLYVGINENGVLGNPSGYLTYDSFANLNTTGNINAVESINGNILQSTNFVNIGTFLQLTPQGSAPASPSAGMVYYDSGSNTLQCYNGTAWKTITMS